MREHWELEDLIASWTLDEDDWWLLANKTGATRLGFALLLKFFDSRGASRRTGRSCRARRSTTSLGR